MDKICKWCGEPIRREDCPNTNDHGFLRLKYHPGYCAAEAKRKNTQRSHQSAKPFVRIYHRSLKERIALLKKENDHLREELLRKGWM